MSDNMFELARRAVACRGWRWMRGMLRQDDYRYVGSGVWARWSDVHSLTTALHSPDQWPDLADPATLGCLLALVREVRKSPAGSVFPHHVTVPPDLDFDVWSWYDSELPRIVVMDGSSAAEAMVAALEAAL